MKTIDLYWNKETYCYDIKTENMYVPYYLFDYEELNGEVEIIEEDKKIEKIVELSDYQTTDMYAHKRKINETIDKINELIDAVNQLKGSNDEKV